MVFPFDCDMLISTQTDLTHTYIINEHGMETGTDTMAKQSNLIGWSTLGITGLLGAATIIFGAYKFYDELQHSARKPFNDMQLELSVEASKAVSVLAFVDDEEKWRKAREEFWGLYWGPLAIVEDDSVARVMIEIGEKIPIDGNVPRLPATDLKKLSIKLAKAIRNQTANSWGVGLGKSSK